MHISNLVNILIVDVVKPWAKSRDLKRGPENKNYEYESHSTRTLENKHKNIRKFTQCERHFDMSLNV